MAVIRLTKEFSFEAAHALDGYDGPCREIHGHSYRLFVTVKGTPAEDASNPKCGMVLDFGVLIQPADLSKYDYVNLPEKDVWGVVTRKDSSLAARRVITRQDLLGEPLILSRQAIRRTSAKNEFIEWFEEDFEKLDVVATLNLVYNATILAESGIGHVVTLDGLVNTSEYSNLCFRFLEPRLESGLNIVWKNIRFFPRRLKCFFRKFRKPSGRPIELPQPQTFPCCSENSLFRIFFTLLIMSFFLSISSYLI